MKLSPPRGLHDESRKLWSALVSEYDFARDTAGLGLLEQFCRTHSRLIEVRAAIAAGGLVTSTGRANPLLATESQLKRDLLAFTRMLRISFEG